MSLLNDIKKEQLQARRDGRKATAKSLTTLIGEAAMVGKNAGNRESTDKEVRAVIKKFIKNDIELIKSLRPGDETRSDVINEIDLLNTYIPTQMSVEELKVVVQKFIDNHEDVSPRMMGQIMKWLKENYEGQYDGSMASGVVRELLK